MAQKKILVIDDEMELVMAIKIRLEAAGYEVVTAYDGQEGLAVAERAKPNLVLLDISMPVMDGYTALRELRARYNRETLPVIMLTAKGRMRDLFELEGIEDYIVKPFEYDDLLLRIDRTLRRAEPHPQH